MNIKKVAIIGVGAVGASIAFSLMEKGIFNEIVLIDNNKDKAIGEAMDLSHGILYASSPSKIYAGEYKDIKDAALVIITAGAAQKDGETRLDLVKKNSAIMKSIISNIKPIGIEGILLIVSNPVDVLTHVAYKYSGLDKSRVIGSGTVLDTARLKYMISEHLKVDSRNVHAVMIGEHGDTELPVWSGANISGVPLNEFCELRGHHNHEEGMNKLYSGVRNAAYEIIKRKGSTYYGIAMAVTKICECIVNDEKSMLPISVELSGTYGLNDIALSIPSILGRKGVELILELPLSEIEENRLKESALTLKKVIDEID